MSATTQPKRQCYDAIVIGAGPAGATSAAVLARKGYSVLVLERKSFPRFHIGESLLPYMTRLMEKMGMLDTLKQGDFVLKVGAEFTNETDHFKRVDFTAIGKGRIHYAFQVERATFDTMLLNHAKHSGAEVLEDAQVQKLLFDGERIVGVEYVHAGHSESVRATYVIDASGRAGKIANHFNLRKTNERQRMVAVFNHFTNVREENNPGRHGDIQIGNHKEGWVWAIPIREDVMSVGAVTRVEVLKQSTPHEIFQRHYTRIPRIVSRLQGATPVGDVRGESDFSYHSDTLVGPGYFIVGDAGCFVDPIFSGGVYLAVVSGMKAAETIDVILTGQVPEQTAQLHYQNFYKTGYDCYFRLIYGFYECEFDFDRYIASIPLPVEGKWSTRTFAGDFWSLKNPMTNYVRLQRKWDTFERFDFTYGCPVYPEVEATYEHA
jgi:geranylgeranyl reductase family protein